MTEIITDPHMGKIIPPSLKHGWTNHTITSTCRKKLIKYSCIGKIITQSLKHGENSLSLNHSNMAEIIIHSCLKNNNSLPHTWLKWSLKTAEIITHTLMK